MPMPSGLMPMPSEREKLVRDINGLKESISLAWMDMISKPMTSAERGEFRKSINSLVKDLDMFAIKTRSATKNSGVTFPELQLL
jgi:hypothetical protein